MQAELWRILCDSFQIFVSVATGINFAYTVKSADPENPLFGARILAISPIQAE